MARGPHAARGPQGSHTYIDSTYLESNVKVILSIRLESLSFFPHVSYETAYLVNQK